MLGLVLRLCKLFSSSGCAQNTDSSVLLNLIERSFDFGLCGFGPERRGILREADQDPERLKCFYAVKVPVGLSRQVNAEVSHCFIFVL